MKFKKYDVYCPACGHLNKNLYLEETHGWMECERCLALVKVDLSRAAINFAYETELVSNNLDKAG